MKKLKMLVALSLLLTACGGTAATEVPKTEPVAATEVTAQTESAATEMITETPAAEDDTVGRVEESEMGTRTTVHSKKGLSEARESGPFEIKVTDIQVSDVVLSEDFKPMFDGKDRVTIVTMAVEVENKSTETNTIHPAQGTIITNTKEQANTDLWMSDDIGGDFIGEVIKRGVVITQLESPAEEVQAIKYIIGAPSSAESYESIGEDIEFEFDFTK